MKLRNIMAFAMLAVALSASAYEGVSKLFVEEKA